jgi:hypothetical protein
MKTSSSRAETHKRLNRLPPFAQKLVGDHAAARQLLATAPIVRMLIANGVSISPGLGLAEFDACIALVNDAIGVARLTDEEFEHALRLSTPPECRETS